MDEINITYDKCEKNGDVPALVVARDSMFGGTKVINIITGTDATRIYKELVHGIKVKITNE